MSSTVQLALRWILFLPGALIAAYLIYLVIVFTNRWAAFMSQGDPEWILSKVFTEVVSHGAMGAVFVYAGSRIAPGYRKIVSYLLSALVILFGGFALFPAVAARDWWAVVGCICVVSGGALVGYSVVEGDINLDTYRLT